MSNILDKTLVTGSGGTVGSYIDFGMRIDREAFDITDTEEVVKAVEKFRPEVILHLAAETDLERCEKDPAHAYLVNSTGTYNLALAAKKIGARMVYISTDDVFTPGNVAHFEEDKPMPAKVYGHSKYLGELAVRGVLDDYFIVRTAWVFGGGQSKDKKFVAKIIQQLSKEEISVVSDQSSSPTFAADLAETLKRLILKKEQGLIHVTNDGTASRYDVACEIVKLLGSKTKVKPVSAETFKLPPYLRSSGGLVSSRIKLRPWPEALKGYLSTEWKK